MRAIDEQLRGYSRVLYAMLLLMPLTGLACTKSPPPAEPVAVKQPADEPKKLEAPVETPKKATQPAEEPKKPEPAAEQPKQTGMPAPQPTKAETQVAKLEPQTQKAPEPKKETLKPVLAKIRIASEPSGAEIVLDRTVVAGKTTPAEVELTAGQHVVQVKKANYQPSEERTITVSADSGSVEVAFTLQTPPADKVSVAVRCDPSTATVLIDGKSITLDQGKAKLKLPQDFAKLEVNATAANHVTFDRSFSRAEIDAVKKVLAVRLNPYLRIEQKNAEVWVAGKPLTADSERRYELQRNADDRYQLIVTCPGFTSYTGTLTYEELRQKEFTLSLAAEAKRDSWLARAGKLTRQPPWQSHTNTVYSVAFSQKDRLLASAGRDAAVKLWSYPEKEQNGSFPAATASEFKQDKPVLAVAFSPDGQWLATGGADKKARLWNVQSRQTVAEFANDDWVWSVAFSRDSKTLAAGLGDGSVSLWNVAARSRIGDPKQLHDETIACVAFSPDDRTLATAGADGSVGLWVVGTTETAMLRAGTKAVHCVAFSPDGTTLASGGDDNAITLWEASKRQKRATLENDGQPVRCLAFSPDGEVLASGGGEKAVKLWNVAGKAMLQSLSFNEEAYSVAFGPSNWLLAAGGVSGGVAVWRSSEQQNEKK